MGPPPWGREKYALEHSIFLEPSLIFFFGTFPFVDRSFRQLSSLIMNMDNRQ